VRVRCATLSARNSNLLAATAKWKLRFDKFKFVADFNKLISIQIFSIFMISDLITCKKMKYF